MVLADTIRKLTKAHLDNGGLIMGQCLTAVGWVQHTIPEQVEGVIELPMTDVSGAGFAVGAALAGRRPILVIRFQSFLWLNASPIANYAARAKEVFGYPCSMLIRAIASEGGGSGPIHTNCYHSIFMGVPGLKIAAPMTSDEYELVWSAFLNTDDPILVSEHRESYKRDARSFMNYDNDSRMTIFTISATRFPAEIAVERLRQEGVYCDLFPILWLKPFDISWRWVEKLKRSKRGLVLDSAPTAGAAEMIAHRLAEASGVEVSALGMEDRVSGCSPETENGTPSVETIMNRVRGIYQRGKYGTSRLPAISRSLGERSATGLRKPNST